MTPYARVAGLVSQMRNARFGEMVKYSEALIQSGIWRDFTTPRGTHFTFRRCEFDYFLAAEELDALTLRYAYLKAPEVTAAQLMTLADITGRGAPPKNGDRRTPTEVAAAYAHDPAGARIEKAEPVVTDRTALVAKTPDRRRAYLSQVNTSLERTNAHCWRARWTGDRSAAAEAIADKLLETPSLARAVFRRLYSECRPERHAKKRK